MTGRLAYQVVVLDEDGEAQTFDRGTTPPDWAAEKITNPACWVVEDDAAGPAAASAGVAEVPPAPENPEPAATPGSAESDGSQPPAGNASTEDWAAFAKARGVEVPEDAKRDEIKTLLRDRGLIES